MCEIKGMESVRNVLGAWKIGELTKTCHSEATVRGDSCCQAALEKALCGGILPQLWRTVRRNRK